MRICDLLKPESVAIGASATDKADAIHQLVELMAKGGNVVDKSGYEQAVLAREAEFSTGMDGGIAIPHAKTEAVDAPGLAAMTLPAGVDFDSTDGAPSTLIFLIAAPAGGADVHLQVLSRLSTLLIDEELCAKLRAASSVEEFRALVDAAEDAKLAADDAKAAAARAADAAGYDVVAITACPTGIAHTYMAAEALEKQAKAMGIKIKVETQGSEGAKNVLSAADVAGAKGVIIAADKNVDLGRFAGKPLFSTSVTRGINEPKQLIDSILEGKAPVYEGVGTQTQVASDDESIGHQIYKHLMNGVSHMLPFVVGGGILLALSFLLDQAGMGTSSYGSSTPVAAFFNLVGGQAFSFMLPVLAGFIASSIADRPGLAPGFVAGWIAKQGYTFAYISSGMDDSILVSAGFLGALLAGFAAGYITLGLKKVFSGLPKALDGIKPVLLYPLFGVMLSAFVMMLVNPVMGAINTAISDFLNSLSGVSSVLLGALVGGMEATDMGGPINKAAYVFGTASIESAGTNGSAIMAAVMAGGMVPPLAIALCTTLFKNRWTADERKAGIVNYVMGLSFITEGAIPYAAADPLRVIPSCIAGSAVAGALSMLFGCASPAPHGGFWVIAVIHNPLGYVLAIAGGMVVGALVLAALKKPLSKEEAGLE